jgi:hypothetical protein
MVNSFKILREFVMFSIVVHTIYRLYEFKVEDHMTNVFNQSHVNTINISSHLEYTEHFTKFDYLSGNYLASFYKSKNEDIYHNILSHPNFTCYSPETIKCIKDTSTNFNYLYGNFGYYHCGLMYPEMNECENDFATKFLDTNYQVFISTQNRYNMKTLSIGLLFMCIKLVIGYLVINIIYFIKLLMDYVEYLFGVDNLNGKFKVE